MRRLLFVIVCVLSATSAGAQNFLDAMRLFNENNFEGAREQFLSIIASDENDDASFYYAGMCDVNLKDVSEAEMFLSKAVELDPENFWYGKSLADLYLSTNRQQQAILLYEKLLEQHPQKTELYYNLVNLYARQNKIDKVLEKLQEIETVSGKSESVTLARYDVLMRQNKPEEAFAALKAFNDEYSSLQVLTTMADFQLSMDRDSLALQYYEEALALDASYTPALLGKADVYRFANDYDGFFKLVETFVSDPEAVPQSKIQYLSALIQSLSPEQYEQYASSIDSLLRTCVLLHQENYDVRVFYTQFLAYINDWYELIDQAEEAYSLFPEENAFLEMKTLAYYNLEDYEGLIRESERIISSAPDDTITVLNAYATIGDAYHILGDAKKAYSVYEKALKINPNYVPVLNNFAYYLSVEGKKLKKAYKMSKITVEAEPDNATYLDTFGWILYLQGKAVEAKPFFKHAMLYGGKDSAVILKHYAAVLRALHEDDMANVYEKMADGKE